MFFTFNPEPKFSKPGAEYCYEGGRGLSNVIKGGWGVIADPLLGLPVLRYLNYKLQTNCFHHLTIHCSLNRPPG